jgi:hypothetical protein
MIIRILAKNFDRFILYYFIKLWRKENFLPWQFEKLLSGDYNLHIKPILSDGCFKCHSPDKTKSKLRLLVTFEEQPKKLKEIIITPSFLEISIKIELVKDSRTTKRYIKSNLS